MASIFLGKFCPLLVFPLVPFSLTFALLIAPAAFLLVVGISGRQFVQEAARIKRVFVCTAIASVMYTAFCVLNIVLDTHPPIAAPARVISKSSGRASRLGGTAYILQLSLSWDQRQLEAGCSVSPEKFSNAESGDSVRLVVHPGAFSQAWYGDVLVDE